MNSNKPSWRHHYLPQFYLRHWATHPGGHVWCYKRLPNGSLEEKSVVPKSTGYVEHLYTYRHAVPFMREEPADIIEKGFFQQIDDAGARALRTLQGDTKLTGEDREAWATFLSSMLHRSEQAIAEKDALAPALVEQTLAKLRAMNTTHESAARLEKTLSALDIHGMALNSVRESVVRETKNPRLLQYFKDQTWSVVGIDPAFPLVTTDTPLIINVGKSERPINLLTCALSPVQLLIMHSPEWNVDDDEFKQLVEALAVGHNLLHVCSRAKRLYSQQKLADNDRVRLRTAVYDAFDAESDSGERQVEPPH